MALQRAGQIALKAVLSYLPCLSVDQRSRLKNISKKPERYVTFFETRTSKRKCECHHFGRALAPSNRPGIPYFAILKVNVIDEKCS